MAKKPFTQKEFKYIYSKATRLAVELVVKMPDGLLMTFRTLPSWHNLWHLPGGTVYYKETLDKAIQRVAKEELGISVVINGLLGYIEWFSEQKERGFGWTISLVFKCRPKNLKQKTRPNHEASSIKAFKKLPKNVIKEHARFLKLKGLLD